MAIRFDFLWFHIGPRKNAIHYVEVNWDLTEKKKKNIKKKNEEASPQFVRCTHHCQHKQAVYCKWQISQSCVEVVVIQ